MSLVACKSDVKEVLSLLASAEVTSGIRVLSFTNRIQMRELKISVSPVFFRLVDISIGLHNWEHYNGISQFDSSS